MVKRALNIAAVVWSKGFVKGLRDSGCEVEVVTLCPEQAWPVGRVIWQDNNPKLFDHDVPVTAISYLNVVFLRERWQDWAFARAVKRLLKLGKFDVFICYNVLHTYHITAMKAAKSMGVPVIAVILDSGYSVDKQGLGLMSHQARYADGVVFLSQWLFENFPANGRRLMQMEGGVSEWKGSRPLIGSCVPVRPQTVTYAGAFTPHRGQGLVDLVKNCKREDVCFVICGKWNMEAAKKAFGDDPRVDLRGMVSHDELQTIYSQTDVFVNSREVNWGHNLANFPSKLSAYLGYGRPIVSNWNPSYPPEYRNLLEVSTDDSGASLAAKLDEVLDWDDGQRLVCYDKLFNAYNENKSWKRQAESFLEFVKEVRNKL